MTDSHTTRINDLESSWHRRLNRRRRHHRNGLITWGTLLSVLLLMILVSLVSNTLITVNQKMETQNMADSAAYSGSVWMARGMNFVSTTNHVIGELNALYVVHHAMGGKWLDEHYNDKRNSGDSRPTLFPPMGFGGIWYQISHNALPINYGIARTLSAIAFVGKQPEQKHFDTVKKHPYSDIHSAIWEGKEMLKLQMNAAYLMHSGGAALVIYGYYQIYQGVQLLSNPYTFAAGLALIAKGLDNIDKGKKIMKAAHTWETAIYLQYTFLDIMEDFAGNMVQPKQALSTVMTMLHGYQKLSVGVLFPMNAIETADEFAQRNGMTAFVLGDVPSLDPDNYESVGDIFSQASEFLPSLPVEKENITDEEKSQMIRATNPWARFWRTPIQGAFMLGAPLSGASGGYLKWTNRYIYQCSEFQRTDKGEKCKNEATCLNRQEDGLDGRGILMYVVKDLNEDGEKGEEDWNQEGIMGSTRADAIFCLMGYAKSKRPPLKSPAFFRQENPNGMVCYSQAMIYNANPQPAAGEADGGNKQPKVAWDTLAWDHDRHRVPEWRDFGEYTMMHRIRDLLPDMTAPKTKLNWQAKLSPVTAEKLTKTAVVAAAYDATVGDGEISQILMNGQEGNFLDKATHVGSQALLQNH